MCVLLVRLWTFCWQVSNPMSLAELPPSYNFSSCAVVGNAGTMHGTKYGAVIDSHDAVFRLNQAPTATYEQWVGKKTTVRLLNREWIKKYSHTKSTWLPHEHGAILLSRGDAEQRNSKGKLMPIFRVGSYRRRLEAAVAEYSMRVGQLRIAIAKGGSRVLQKFQVC